MLNTVLEKLQNIFSKQFVISSVFPVLLFLLLNGITLYQFSDNFRALLSWYRALDRTGELFCVVILFILLTVIASVYSTLNLFLRDVLEGKYGRIVLAGQLRRKFENRDQLDRLIRRYMDDRDDLSGELDKGRPGNWYWQLDAARTSGLRKLGPYRTNEKITRALSRIRKQASRIESLSDEAWISYVGRIRQIVPQFVEELQATAVDSFPKLDEDYALMLQIIRRTANEADQRVIRYFNARQFNYSNSGLAPTQLGNVAESVRDYAQGRYSMNLDFIWTRLQNVLRKDSPAFYSVIQDAKAQLDFTVGLVWVFAGYTGIWVAGLPILSFTYMPLLLVGVLGPLAALASYSVAVQNYRSFADLLRSALDLHRFDLLKAYHLPLPSDSLMESDTWDQLNRQKCWGDATSSTTFKH